MGTPSKLPETAPDSKEKRRERWTNEAARILWNALAKDDNARSPVRVYIDGWKSEYFPEGQACQAEILSVGEDMTGTGQKQIDIAVVRLGEPGEVLALIEVEESGQSGASRIKLNTDADNILRGRGIIIGGKLGWGITAQTALGVLFYGTSERAEKRGERVQEEVIKKGKTWRRDGWSNACIEAIVIREFGPFEEQRNPRERLEKVMNRPLDCRAGCADKRCEKPELWAEDPTAGRVAAYVRRELNALRRRLERPDLSKREAADLADVIYGTLRSVLLARVKDHHMIRALSDSWGFSIIDYHIRASGKLRPEDVGIYTKLLQDREGGIAHNPLAGAGTLWPMGPCANSWPLRAPGSPG